MRSGERSLLLVKWPMLCIVSPILHPEIPQSSPSVTGIVYTWGCKLFPEQDPSLAMAERKPPHEEWESFTERKIREAQSEGAFANLPGFGQPIPGIDEPAEENWWVRDKLRREQLSLPHPVLEARLCKERELAALPRMGSEQEVRRRMQRLNEQIRAAHFSHLPGPADGVLPVDIEAAVAQWRCVRQSDCG